MENKTNRNVRTASRNLMEVYKCDFLNVRKGPSTKYAIGFKIYTDRVVQVVSKQGNWARLKFNGSYGWASLLYLRNVKHTNYSQDTKIYKLTASVNFRRAQDWNSHILYIGAKNELIYVVDDSDSEWLKVWFANKYMYVPKAYAVDTGQIKPGGGEEEVVNPPLTEEKEEIRPILPYKNQFWIDIFTPDVPKFRFNTSELDVHMITKPTEIISMLKYDTVEALNMDGDLPTSLNTYDTTEIEIEFYIKKENYKFVLKKLKQITKMPSFRLTFGWDRRFFRYARLADNIEIEEEDFDDLEAKMTLVFELQPYKYAQEGIYYAKDINTGESFLQNGSTILNNYEESYPKLYVPIPHTSLCKTNENGKKEVCITLYSEEKKQYFNYYLKAHNEEFEGDVIDYIYAVIDSVTGNVYEDTTNRNLNYLYKIENDFPILYEGKTTITQSANYKDTENKYKQFKIIPNWREL